MSITFKQDQYKTNRGGRSHLLDIRCYKCQQHLCFYQKDGPGPLMRMYLDRILRSPNYQDLAGSDIDKLPDFTCPQCQRVCHQLPKRKQTCVPLIPGFRHQENY